MNKFTKVLTPSVLALTGVIIYETFRGPIEMSQIYYWLLFLSAYEILKN